MIFFTASVSMIVCVEEDRARRQWRYAAGGLIRTAPTPAPPSGCCGHQGHSPAPGQGCTTYGCLCLSPAPEPPPQEYARPELVSPPLDNDWLQLTPARRLDVPRVLALLAFWPLPLPGRNRTRV